MKRLLASLILLTLISSSPAQAQKMAFALYVFGDSVGHSDISKAHDADGNDRYLLDTYVKAKILWITRENHTHYESVFKNGKLISATYYEINNGKKDKWSIITFDGKVYSVDSYHGKKTFTEAPTHSIGSMYCDGYSATRKRFFYEPEADFSQLTFPEANTIEFKSSDGNRNVYHFRGGQISDVECHTTLATIHIKRIK
ncbi:MAG: hypothetical protein JWO03_1618 [Bacteroidetes bacterium]|nr:hypothetical protein [Bacteroidota bacterium]